jgi:hypothetical protein
MANNVFKMSAMVQMKFFRKMVSVPLVHSIQLSNKMVKPANLVIVILLRKFCLTEVVKIVLPILELPMIKRPANKINVNSRMESTMKCYKRMVLVVNVQNIKQSAGVIPRNAKCPFARTIFTSILQVSV